jgi:hypothetical protein
MPILVQCDECSRRGSVKEEWAGRRVKCPGCGAAINVPSASVMPPVAVAQQPAPRQSPASPPPLLSSAPLTALAGKPPGQKSRKPRSAGKIMGQLAAGVGGLIVAVYMCLVVTNLIRSGRRLAPGAARAGFETRLVGPVWSPDASAVNLLAPETSFAEYGWRLPAGFTPGPTPPATVPAGLRAQNWAWLGAPRADGTRPVATASVVDMSQAADMTGTLEDALAAAMAAFPKASGLVDFKSTSGERGVLAEKACIRCRFSGRIGAATMHGQMVMFLEGHRLVAMSMVSTEPEASAEQQQLTAAMLTFRQR